MRLLRPIQLVLLSFCAIFLCPSAAFATSLPTPGCLYALDPTASRAFQIAGVQSVYTACGVIVESTASDGFEMEGSETLYLQNHTSVSVVGGAQLNGQTYLVDTIGNTHVSAVQVTSPGDPLASIAAPTSGTIVKASPAYYDMNSKPADNTLSPGVYCGGLTIGNTNGTAFTLSPGVYIMAGGGLLLNSQAVVSGTGVTIYNTSSAGWGCSGSYNYTPVTISGQVTANLSAPTSGAFDGILFFGNRTGCATAGSCQDQINGGSTAILNGALYFKSDQITITGSNPSGYTMLVADKIYINGNSAFGDTGDPFDGITVAVTPSSASLNAGQTQQFTATVTGSNPAVTWTISPSNVGTISPTGLYTAPSSITAQQIVTVTATSQADTTKSVSVPVTLYPPVTVSVSPSAATLYPSQTEQLTATVTDTSNTAVTWSLSGAGTISSTGLYTAPASIAAQQTVTVTATSQANTSISASSTIVLSPPIAVSVTPAAATLYASQTQQFVSTVTNTSNTSVTWSVSGAGTISSGGLYTAPSSIATQQTAIVTATSQASSTALAAAAITLLPPVEVSVTPSTASLLGGQTQQLTATVANASDTAVTWTVTGAGSVSASGLYSAPATVATQQTVTVTATSAADSTKAATATITLLAPPCATGPYGYYRAITIDHTKVPNTDQTDYPMLVSGAYPFLASVANAGQVQSPNGYDIIFTADSAGQVPLDFEIDSYNSVTGTAAFWVRIPTLSHTLNTTIYMWYGNSAITSSQENKAGVWRNNYLSVYHFGSGSSGAALGVADSGSAGYGLLGSASAVAGMFGGGAGFSGDSYTYLYNDSIPGYPSGEQPVTLEAWAQIPAGSSPATVVGYGQNGYNGSRIALVDGSNLAYLDFENIDTNSSVSAGMSWHHLVGTYSGGDVSASNTQLYFDGIALPPTTAPGAVNIALNELKIGGVPTVTFCCGFTGSIDEVRISSGSRSPDWVATEFNNESSPSTFHTMSSQNPLTVSPSSEVLYSLQTQQFSALAVPGCAASAVTSAVWSVSPAGTGTINSSGLYTAPVNSAISQTVTITATSSTNPAQSGTASVTLLPPTVVTVTPATATLHDGQTQQFAASVTNAINTAVTWTVNPSSGGSISAGGLFTAATSTPTQQTVTVTATSVADPTQSGTATITLFPVQCASTGFDYQRIIKINHNKIQNTDQTNFPVLISGTYPFLATVANGGRLRNASGYDVVFTSDFAGKNALDYEIDSYNATTGAAAYWVRIPTLSHTADTTIYMWYGNPSVAASLENKAGVWSNGYAGVWHFGSPNAISAADSTSYANNGINHSVAAAAGIIGGSGVFDGSGSTYFDIPSSNSYKPTSTLTLEAWVNMGSTHFPNVFSLDLRADGSYNYPYQTYALGMFQNSLEPAFTSTVNGNQFSWTHGANQITTGQWTHIVSTYDGQTATVYTNGVVTATALLDGPLAYGTSKDLAIGVNSPYAIQNALAGLVDEARISTVARSQDWIATEYNNQNAPAAFYTVFPESAGGVVPGAVTLYGSQSQQFLVAATCDAAASAVWSMPSGSPGTLSPAGLYTAPASIETQQTVTITGTTLGATSTQSTAVVTLMPPVSISVAPLGVTLAGGQTQQFTASVTNAADTAVTWSIR